MKRIAVLMLVAGLAACGSSKETPEAGSEDSVAAQGDDAAAGESPSDVTAIDAATGFAGGMPAETPASALPDPQDARPKPAHERKPKDEEEAPLEPIVNIAPPSLPPTAPSNTTTTGQPPQ